ncbi:MAG TPA: metal-sulfur cluster assembly factor [Acidothermaceae bacterium]
MDALQWLDAVDGDAVLEALHEVIDPELGVNIVDLGLVYDVAIGSDGDVAITMTLTTPGCPLGGYLEDEINGCLRRFPAVRAVSVDLVWEPPWGPAAMTDAAKRQLGWRG